MKLAAVGSNCVDFYNNIENGKAYPGGSPVNVAVYTVRLGGEASYTPRWSKTSWPPLPSM